MSDVDNLFEELLVLQAGKKLPPVHLWHPEQIGDIDIRIDANGNWFHEGARIQRQPLVNLFATIMRREGDDYYLITPAEKQRIEVADVPFMAIDMDVRGSGTDTELLFTINVGDYVMAGTDHAIVMRDDIPYLHVRDGLEAKITRSVFYRLVEVGQVEAGQDEQNGALYVYSQGARFDLGLIS